MKDKLSDLPYFVSVPQKAKKSNKLGRNGVQFERWTYRNNNFIVLNTTENDRRRILSKSVHWEKASKDARRVVRAARIISSAVNSYGMTIAVPTVISVFCELVGAPKQEYLELL